MKCSILALAAAAASRAEADGVGAEPISKVVAMLQNIQKVEAESENEEQLFRYRAMAELPSIAQDTFP